MLVVALVGSAPAAAQEPGATSTTATSTTDARVPTNEIIPKPNSGVPPEEPGDRGGVLQLGLLALVVLAVTGAVVGLVRQSRRART